MSNRASSSEPAVGIKIRSTIFIIIVLLLLLLLLFKGDRMDTPRQRVERAIADLVASDGIKAVTVARVRTLARTEQAMTADVVREWREGLKAGTTDKVIPPSSDGETRAYETLRAIIRKTVLESKAEEISTVNDALAGVTAELEEARKSIAELEEQILALKESLESAEAEKLKLQVSIESEEKMREEQRQELEAVRKELQEETVRRARAEGMIAVYDKEKASEDKEEASEDSAGA